MPLTSLYHIYGVRTRSSTMTSITSRTSETIGFQTTSWTVSNRACQVKDPAPRNWEELAKRLNTFVVQKATFGWTRYTLTRKTPGNYPLPLTICFDGTEMHKIASRICPTFQRRTKRTSRKADDSLGAGPPKSLWLHEMWFLYDKNWRKIGDKHTLQERLTKHTNIAAEYLLGHSGFSSASVSHRMSWYADRETTVPEDTAYCLLGLFGANMPLLYEEGRERAFYRLQEEIKRYSDDHSIFAWEQCKGDSPQ